MLFENISLSITYNYQISLNLNIDVSVGLRKRILRWPPAEYAFDDQLTWYNADSALCNDAIKTEASANKAQAKSDDPCRRHG